jgi:signal transduction histidine kinase
LKADRKYENQIRLVVAGLTILCVRLLQQATPDSWVFWNTFFQHLYFVPIVVAAIYFGWRGGLGAAILSGLCHASSLSFAPGAQGHPISYLALAMNFLFAGVVAGILADRERRQKRVLQQTTQQLSAVYREFQDNFEGMKRAERLYALGQLSAGLAHEVRNPLASIEGAAAILQKEPGTEERHHEFLEIIQKECRRLNRLLTNFLDFAKPRLPQYQAIEVGQVLDSVISLAAHAIGRKAIRLLKDLPPNPPILECDPEQLKQVLLNLTINAIQAMPDGGEIVLAAKQQGEKILIQVRDQGSGISPANLDKTFDPFFTTKENGTGLGLPVAHQIVSQHGGVLSVENNVDKGTTFAVLLPLQHGRDL